MNTLVSRARSCRLLLLAGVVLSLLACSGSPDALPARQMQVSEIAATIGARLAADADPLLQALYATGGNAPLWIDLTGRPSQSAREALKLLEAAAADGLDPSDYDSDRLGRESGAIESARPPLVEDVADFDVALSASMLRYLRHLHMGRVDPQTIGFKLTVPAEQHEFGTLLRSALADGRIAETAAELAPQLVQYRALRAMLERYRSLATDTTFEPLPPHRDTVHPGEPYGGLRGLYQRLVAFGDLSQAAFDAAEGAAYDGLLVEGVKRFQARHGLEGDGVLGKATVEALRVPLTWRVRQIELALERLRWLPDLGRDRFIALNIPMFNLWAWDSIPPSGAPSFGIRAIVGRALSTQTPVFVEEMRYVIFRPYWNVPPSILRNEILPVLAREPDYLNRQDMEIVRGPGDAAQPVAATSETIALLRQGALRVRQRPGPRNALGLVKFVFPNDENVYMHGTPAQELFSRTRRDFSHGCVRLEDPVALAEWVLNDQPEWTRDRILAAMSGTQPRLVNLSRPIQVILFYVTAVVMPEDGTIRFAEDIYRHDAKLDGALSRLPGA